jgi:hypothetical protein
MGIQTNNMIARNVVETIRVGSEPKYLSATNPSSGRTGMPTALMTTSRFTASSGDRPTTEVAYVLMKKKQKYSAQKIKNTPIVKREYVGSRNAFHSTTGPALRGGRRGLRRRMMTIANARAI